MIGRLEPADQQPAADTTGSGQAARLDDDDLSRHGRMLRHLQEAQQLAAQAQQLQARASELAAAFKVWAEELHERYEIPPGADNGVDEFGNITRGHAVA